jgi:hypothetical protein
MWFKVWLYQTKLRGVFLNESPLIDLIFSILGGDYGSIDFLIDWVSKDYYDLTNIYDTNRRRGFFSSLPTQVCPKKK